MHRESGSGLSVDIGCFVVVGVDEDISGLEMDDAGGVITGPISSGGVLFEEMEDGSDGFDGAVSFDDEHVQQTVVDFRQVGETHLSGGSAVEDEKDQG